MREKAINQHITESDTSDNGRAATNEHNRWHPRRDLELLLKREVETQ